MFNTITVDEAGATHVMRENAESRLPLASSPDIEMITEAIRSHHRGRRFAMKTQQKLERSLEAFVRRNYTDWSPELSKEDATKCNARVKTIIKLARDFDSTDEDAMDVRTKVTAVDSSLEPWCDEKAAEEKSIKRLVRSLPIFPWMNGVLGAAEGGIGIIIGEAGDLSKYATVDKLWSRLGFAPFEGYAGSTWRRGQGSRKLTADEWIAHPFAAERYAMIYTVADSLSRAQVLSMEKSGTRYGKPKGPYGEVYVRRREHTAVTHPDWSDGHARLDALRVMMKRFLRDLWREWRRADPCLRESAGVEMPVAD